MSTTYVPRRARMRRVEPPPPPPEPYRPLQGTPEYSPDQGPPDAIQPKPGQHPLYTLGLQADYEKRARALGTTDQVGSFQSADPDASDSMAQAAASQNAWRSNLMWKFIDLATIGQQFNAGIAFALAQGDKHLWQTIGDAVRTHQPGVAGAALLEAGVKGTKENRSFVDVWARIFQDLGVNDENFHIRVPYAPDISASHTAIALGFLSDVALDPTTYVGIGGLTRTGKLARAWTEAAHMGIPVNELGELPAAIEAARLEGKNIQFGRNLYERVERKQVRFFVLEHPFRRPTVVRFGDVPSLAKAGEVIHEMVPFSTPGMFEKFQQLPVGISVTRAKPQFGVEGGARITLGHLPGTRSWAPTGGQGWVRKVFNAEKGIRDKRLGDALLEVPLFKLPSFEPFRLGGVEAIGLSPGKANPIESGVVQMMGKASRALTESPGIGTHVIDSLRKGFLPYYRPIGANPVVHQEVMTELRALSDGISIASDDLKERLYKAFESDDHNVFVAKAIPMLRQMGLEEDGQVISMLKGLVPREERVKFLASMESYEKLVGPDGGFAAELVQRMMDTDPGIDLLRAEKYESYPEIARRALLDGLDSVNRAIAVNEQDLVFLDRGLEPARVTLHNLGSPEAMRAEILNDQKRLVLMKAQHEAAIDELGGGGPPPGGGGGGGGGGLPTQVFGGPAQEGAREPRPTRGARGVGATAFDRKLPKVSPDFPVAEGITAGEATDLRDEGIAEIKKIREQMARARSLSANASLEEQQAILKHATELRTKETAAIAKVEDLNAHIIQASQREAAAKAITEAGKRAAEHPGAALKAVDFLPEAQTEMQRLTDMLPVARNRDALLRQIRDLEKDSVRSFVERQTRTIPEEFPARLQASAEEALRNEMHQQASLEGEKAAKEALTRAETHVAEYQPDVAVRSARPLTHMTIEQLSASLEPRLQSELAHGALRESLAEVAKTDPQRAAQFAAEAGIPDVLLPEPVLRARRVAANTTGEQYADELLAKAGISPAEGRDLAWEDTGTFTQKLEDSLRESGMTDREIESIDFPAMQSRLRVHEANERMAQLPETGLSLESLGLNHDLIAQDLAPKLREHVQTVRRAIPGYNPQFVAAEPVGAYLRGTGSRKEPVDVILFHLNRVDEGRARLALDADPNLSTLGGPGSPVPPTPAAFSMHLLMEGETPESVVRALSEKETFTPTLRENAPGIYGIPTKATGADPNKVYDLRYKVVELDDLIASHTDALAENPMFPPELQPRMRERAASELQIDKIARRLNPGALLEDVGLLDRGPMIVGGDNIVESGNGRVLALRRARERYPDQLAAYESALRAKAEDYGLADLGRFEHPVLVRERVSEVNRPRFAAEANAPGVLGMSTVEQAIQDSRKITDNMITGLDVAPEQSVEQALRTAGNRPLIRAFIQEVPENERAVLLDPSGNLSQAGIQRIKAAIFAKTYPGEAGQRLTTAFFESLDPGVKRIEAGLFASLPQLARAEGLIRGGQRPAELSISEDLSKAVDMLARLKAQGIPTREFLGQTSLFEKELTPFQEQLVAKLDEISNAPKKVREFVQGYADQILAAPDPNQVALFGGGPTKESILETVGKEAGAKTAGEEGPQLFAQEEGPSAGAFGAQLERRPLDLVDDAVSDALESQDILRKNPQHIRTMDPGDQGERLAFIHHGKVEKAQQALRQWRDAHPNPSASELAHWEKLQYDLETAIPQTIKPVGESLSDVTKRVQGKPRKARTPKSKIDRPLKDTGESVVDEAATPEAIRALIPEEGVLHPNLATLDPVQVGLRSTVLHNPAAFNKSAELLQIPEGTRISEWLNQRHPGTEAENPVSAIARANTENIVRVWMRDGTVYDFSWGKPGGNVDKALAKMEQADRTGVSIVKTFYDQVKNEDGAIDREFLFNLWKAAMRKRELGRAMATEMIDDLIRFDSRYEKQMLRSRQELIEWLHSRWSAEAGWGHGSGFILQYAPHVKVEKTLLGTWMGKSGIKDWKKSYEFHRSFQNTARDINTYSRAAGKGDLFEEDALIALFTRGNQSYQAEHTSQFLERMLDQWGQPVSAINPETFEARLAVAEKQGIPLEQYKRAQQLVRQLDELFANGDEELLKKPEWRKKPPVINMESLVSRHGGLKDVRERGARAGAKTPEAAVKMLPEVKEYLRLNTELEAILPPVAVYMPKGAYRRYPVNAIPSEFVEQTTDLLTDDRNAVAKMRDALAAATGMKTKADEPLIMVPLHKVRQVMASDPFVRAYLLPKPVADAINMGLRNHIQMGPELSKYVRTYKHMLDLWKGYTTVLFPIFFNRNWLSGVNNNMIDGAADFAHYLSAIRLQSGEKEFIFRDAYGRIHTRSEILDGLKANNVVNRGFAFVDLPQQVGDIRWWQSANPASQKFFVLRAGRRINNMIENNLRIAGYLDGVYRGMSPGTAAARVRRLQFDYSELAPFERQIVKLLFPFYTWSRKNIPLQLHYLLTRPAKFTGPIKAMQAFQKSVPEPQYEELISDERQRFLPVRVRQNADGTYSYWNMGGWWPGADLFRLTDIWSELGGMLTPALQVPLQLWTNQSFYFDAPIERYPYQTQEFLGHEMPPKKVLMLKTVRWLNEFDRVYYKTIKPGLLPGPLAVLESAIGRPYAVNFYNEAQYRMIELSKEVDALNTAMNAEGKKLQKKFLAGEITAEDLRNNPRLATIERERLLRIAQINELARKQANIEGGRP